MMKFSSIRQELKQVSLSKVDFSQKISYNKVYMYNINMVV